MTETKTRFREIDVLKGVAIAMVLLGHSIIEFPIDLSRISWCNYLHHLVSAAHMPLFFAISGYCFSFHNWRDYLGKKCRRILIPYLVFSSLSTVSKVLLPSMVNGAAHLEKLGYSILTGGGHWFLYTIFLIFLFFPFIRKCFEEDRRGLICLGLIAALQLFSFWPKLFNLDRLVKFSFFFALGYFIKSLGKRKPTAGKRLLDWAKHPLTVLLCLAAWALLSYVLVWLKEHSAVFAAKEAAELAMADCGTKPESAQGIRLFWAVWDRIIAERHKPLFSVAALTALAASLPGIAAVVGLTLRFCSLRASRLVETAGKDSLQLYLFNGYLLTVTRWLVVTKLHIHTPLVVIGANFFVMYFVSLAIIELIVRRVKLFRTLTGMV